MPAALPIIAGASAVSGFLGQNAQKNAQRANQASANSLQDQIQAIVGRLMGQSGALWGTNPTGMIDTAKNFYTTEVQSGLPPGVRGAATAGFQQNNAQNLATLKNQLGPYTPNMAGTVADFGNNEILGNVSLQDQLTVQDWQARQAGAAGLGGLGTSTAGLAMGGPEAAMGELGGLEGNYLTANMFNAQNSSNPFAGIMSLLAMNPTLFGGGGGGLGAGAGAGTGATIPGLSGPDAYPQPGQGGLGATGGTGGMALG